MFAHTDQHSTVMEAPVRRRGVSIANKDLLPRGFTGVLEDSVPATPFQKVVVSDNVRVGSALEDWYNHLMYPIVQCFKCSDDREPTWDTDGRRAFLSICRSVIQFKRETACLRTEVDNFIWMSRLRLYPPRQRGEDLEDRGKRLHSFWPHFRRAGLEQDGVEDDVESTSSGAPSPAPPLPRRARLVVSPQIGTSRQIGAMRGQRKQIQKVEDAKHRTTWDRCPFAAQAVFKSVSHTYDSSDDDAEESRSRPPSTTLTSTDAPGPTLDFEVVLPALSGRPATAWKPATVVSDAFSSYLESRLLPKAPVETNAKKVAKAKAFIVCDKDFYSSRPFTADGIECPVKPRKRYFKVCDESRTVPRVMPFLTGHSLKLNAVGQSLSDVDLVPIMAMLRETKVVEEINFSSNGLLSDTGLSNFFDALISSAALESLSNLNLHACHQVGRATMKRLAIILGSREPENLAGKARRVNAKHTSGLKPLDGNAKRKGSRENQRRPIRKFGSPPSPRAASAATAAVDSEMTMVTREVRKGFAARQLNELDLGGICIPMKWFHTLAEAISQLPLLRTVRLADTGLGRNTDVSMCLENILSSGSIEDLDISWNTFSAETFMRLGRDVSEAPRLRTLSISNCSDNTGAFGPGTPIEYFFECIATTRVLTRLDISMNHINFQGALIVEDALEHNLSLTDLDISDNALGVDGLRSMLRVLSQDTVGLFRLEQSGCAIGAQQQSDTGQTLSITNPGGRYDLDLSKPYCRSLLRMLYKQCDKCGKSPTDAFTIISWSSRDYKHPVDERNGRRCVATQGQLSFMFDTHDDDTHSSYNYDVEASLQSHFSRWRRRPGFRKAASLFALFRISHQPTYELHALLEALAKDFILTYPQMMELCRDRELAIDVLRRTLHCLEGGRMTRYLTTMLFSSLGGHVSLYDELRNLLFFNIQNPTWHYKFNLSHHADYEVASRLFLVDRWEIEIEKRLKLEDISQMGDRSHIRNVTYRGRSISQPLATWVLPQRDIIEFDYSSGKRPPKGVSVVDHRRIFQPLMITLRKGKGTFESSVQINVLRQISHLIYLSASQIRQLLGHFRDESQRAEVLTLFFFRIGDIHNEKLFRVRFDSGLELNKLRNRLGHLAFFPFLQPEGTKFVLDFANHDERIAGHCLVSIVAEENAHNLCRTSLVRPDGSDTILEYKACKSWENLQSVPKLGTFKAYYTCAPEERSFQTRQRLCSKYGRWEMNISEDDVTWCTALDEVPPDVIEFMEFCVGHYANIKDVYIALDRSGKENVRFADFEEGVIAMGCRKFDGPMERMRILNVFRFLDRTGEGSLSLKEWSVLEQLWNEMILSLEEAIEFFRQTFASRYDDYDFLKKAWSSLDIDGSGSITADEWEELLINKFHFFGQTKVIFEFLDMDDNGSITQDQFGLLQRLAESIDRRDCKFEMRKSRDIRSKKCAFSASQSSL